MSESNPTPDQGDERRALSILATFVHETWAGAYSWSELEHKARTALERAGLLSLQDVLALSAALAAPQPSQGANVKVGGSTVYVTNNHRRESNRWWATVYPGFDDDDKRVSIEECDAIAKRIADALNATPHHPASAEAGKEVVCTVRINAHRLFLEDWNQAVLNTLPDGDIDLYAAPSESVAVSAAPMSQVMAEKVREWIEEAVEYINKPQMSPSLEREGRDILCRLAAAPQKGEA